MGLAFQTDCVLEFCVTMHARHLWVDDVINVQAIINGWYPTIKYGHAFQNEMQPQQIVSQIKPSANSVTMPSHLSVTYARCKLPILHINNVIQYEAIKQF